MSPSCLCQDILPPCRPLASSPYDHSLAGIRGLSTIKPPKGLSKTVRCSTPHNSFISSGSQWAALPLS